MPPRYSYWTIIAGGLPTAFRAADREDLLPTFSQIRHKHPDAQLKWFARGKLWDSPESARLDTERRRARPSQEPRGQGARGRDWRPGGEHRDPRQKYKDAKKERNARERKRKFERRQRFGEGRTFHKKSLARNQGPDERPTPRPRPAPPEREPRPREGNEPTPPPRPAEPVTPSPGPPERGRFHKSGRVYKSARFNKKDRPRR
jgi:hypothetical protein